MICGLEAMVVKADVVQKYEIEQENFRIKWEKEVLENSMLFCENVISPILEKKMKDPKVKDWGGIDLYVYTPMDKNSKKPTTAQLLTTTYSDYADHRLSYKIDRLFDETINYNYIIEYLKSHCWEVESYSFKGYMKGYGERFFRRLNFKPMPKCI